MQKTDIRASISNTGKTITVCIHGMKDAPPYIRIRTVKQKGVSFGLYKGKVKRKNYYKLKEENGIYIVTIPSKVYPAWPLHGRWRVDVLRNSSQYGTTYVMYFPKTLEDMGPPKPLERAGGATLEHTEIKGPDFVPNFRDFERAKAKPVGLPSADKWEADNGLPNLWGKLVPNLLDVPGTGNVILNIEGEDVAFNIPIRDRLRLAVEWTDKGYMVE